MRRNPIEEQQVLDSANKLCIAMKGRPVESRQVDAALRAIVTHVNNALFNLEARIERLEGGPRGK